MATLFLDSSALVKRYVAETGSRWVADLVTPPAGNVVHISIVSGAEVVAALVRRQRAGSLAEEQASRAIAEFADD
jgi:predicted nucleic acid-binding protein